MSPFVHFSATVRPAVAGATALPTLIGAMVLRPSQVLLQCCF
jgi:hypothetical protein